MKFKHQIIGAVLDRAVECGASFGSYSRKDVIGDTGYVDRITPAELPHPVCLGEDRRGRPYVAVRFRRNGQLHVETLFQRYADDTNTWTSGGQAVLVNSCLQAFGPYAQDNWQEFSANLAKLEIM